MTKKQITASLSAIALLALTTQGQTANAKKKEKCYAIVKAGQNDCATNTTSCSGSAKKNAQKDAFIFVPKGLCTKIVGGSLTNTIKKNK
ncbi:MAG: DUF2282 domain-containing protein [Bdellovibrionaceae bacterium]|nr:DUF2282 domain-containing protein [Pseudobdellovibrionaceae bacterium]